MKYYDVVVNWFCSNYEYEEFVANAAIKSKLDQADNNNDYGTRFKMLDLHSKRECKENRVNLLRVVKYFKEVQFDS